MSNIKITKATMNKIELATSGQVDYWDTDLSGFGVRATKDSLTFMVHRRVCGEKNKTFIKIGRFGEFTPEQARMVAKDYIRRMELGEAPHPKLKPKTVTLTVNDLYCQYIAMRKYPLAPTTLYQYESWMKNYFPDWLDRDATNITGEMVAKDKTGIVFCLHDLRLDVHHHSRILRHPVLCLEGHAQPFPGE